MTPVFTCSLLLVSWSAVAGAAPPPTALSPRAPDAPEATVVGGTLVPRDKWRDVVLVVGRDATCTGTLIAPDIVLTAGHCIESEPYEVIADTVDYTRGGDRIAVKWSRAYPDWAHRYDVGVVMLDHVARGRPRSIAPACAARRGLHDGATVHLVGFGMTSDTTDNTRLREVDLEVVDATCTSDRGCAAAVAPHGEFIAGGGGAGSCFGDSGGPVFLTTAEGPALVGVVSRGLAVPGTTCADAGIYVRADKVVSWLQSVTGVDLRPGTCDVPADDPGEVMPGGGCSTTTGAAGPWIAVGLIRRRRRRS